MECNENKVILMAYQYNYLQIHQTQSLQFFLVYDAFCDEKKALNFFVGKCRGNLNSTIKNMSAETS